MSLEIGSSNKKIAVNLVGTCTALLTFTIVFLYERATTGKLDLLLFQLTLVSIILSIFMFTVSALFYDISMNSFASNDKTTAGAKLLIGNGFFRFGLFILLLEPTLITYSLYLIEVAALSLLLWIILVLYAVFMWFRTRATKVI